MKTKYIFPHFGLGDAIITNGLVRYFCQQYDHIVYFCSDVYYDSIKYMFRDLNNLTCLNLGDHSWAVNAAQNFISTNNLTEDVIHIGYEKLYKEYTIRNPGAAFYKSLYTMFDLDISFRFDNFFFKRNFEYENYIFNKLNPNNEQYIFVIDDANHHLGSIVIDDKKISSNYKIIKYDKSLNYTDEKFLMFNYGKIIENAQEVHCIETGFLEFMVSMKFTTPIFIHSYLRNYIDEEYFKQFFSKNFYKIDR
jgi:hypothetical protein